MSRAAIAYVRTVADGGGREGRFALVGTLVGALIGGAASFGGTYLVAETTKDQQELDRQQKAYVAVLTEAEQYR